MQMQNAKTAKHCDEELNGLYINQLMYVSKEYKRAQRFLLTLFYDCVKITLW